MLNGIGGRLEEARLHCGLTLRAAASEYGNATNTTVMNWEKEKSPVSADYVVWLSKRSGWSLVWLLTGEGPQRPEPADRATLLLEEIRELLERDPRPLAVESHPAWVAAGQPLPDAGDNSPAPEDEKPQARKRQPG